MKKGLSTIISVMLVLLIAVATTVLVIMWLPRLTFKIFNIESSFNQSYVRSRACLSLENVDTIGKTLTIKNCGKITLGDFNFYIDENKLSLYLEKLDPQESVTINYVENLTQGEHYFYITSDYAETPVITFSYVTPPLLCDFYIYQSNMTNTYSINQNNKIYCLAENIYISGKNAINFASGVQNSTLECQDYNIDGNDASNTNGVYLTGSFNTIKNCYITDFYTGIYLQNGPSNNILNNIVYNNSYSIYIDSSSNNILTNNTFTKFYNDGFVISNSNNNTITGGSINSDCYDYYLQGAGTTNNFTSTNFTQRSIYFDDSTSWFNYNNETTGNIWLKTSVSAQAAINPRKLLNWNQTLIKWNDTASTSITATYNITGLLTNTNYNIYNNSILVYTLISNFNGEINFTINLPASQEHEIRVERFDGVLWFRFNEGSGVNVFDISAYHNDGTYYGETFNDGILGDGTCVPGSGKCPSRVTGRYGNALQFDGSNDYVNLGNNSALNPRTNDFTISVWFKTNGTVDSLNDWTHDIYYKSKNNSNIGDGINFGLFGYLMTGYTGKATCYALNDNPFLVSSLRYDDSNWHFIVCSINRTGNAVLYVDGQVVDTKSSSGGTFPSSHDYNSIFNATIGSTNNGASRFNGTIDELRIYNRSLSQAEVQAEMNSSLPISRSIASYRFEESANYVNDTHIWVNGTYGPALSFDGANDHVNVSDSNSLDLTNNITIAVWIYSKSYSTFPRIVSKESGTASQPYALELNNTGHSVLFCLDTGSGEICSDSGANTILLNNWYYVVGTWNGNTKQIYINGTLKNSATQSGLMAASINNVIIGNNPSLNRQFNGTIDEVRIWNRTLSLAEIQAEMNKG